MEKRTERFWNFFNRIKSYDCLLLCDRQSFFVVFQFVPKDLLTKYLSIVLSKTLIIYFKKLEKNYSKKISLKKQYLA